MEKQFSETNQAIAIYGATHKQGEMKFYFETVVKLEERHTQTTIAKTVPFLAGRIQQRQRNRSDWYNTATNCCSIECNTYLYLLPNSANNKCSFDGIFAVRSGEQQPRVIFPSSSSSILKYIGCIVAGCLKPNQFHLKPFPTLQAIEEQKTIF